MLQRTSSDWHYFAVGCLLALGIFTRFTFAFLFVPLGLYILYKSGTTRTVFLSLLLSLSLPFVSLSLSLSLSFVSLSLSFLTLHSLLSLQCKLSLAHSSR